VMQGFIRRSIPLFLRRAVTLAPALVVLAIGVDPTDALVISQVVLSFGIPFALIPLVWFTSRRELMGPLVNRKTTTAVAAPTELANLAARIDALTRDVESLKEAVAAIAADRRDPPPSAE